MQVPLENNTDCYINPFVWKQNTQYMYNITLWYVCVTIVEEEMQQCILRILLSYMAWSKIQKYWELHNHNTYLGLHVNCLTLLSNFNQIWIFLTDFHKSPQYPVSWKCVQWEQHWCTQTDGHDDTNGSYCNYVNAPKNAPSYI